MAKEYEPVTYIDIGFNPYGIKSLQSAQAIPANLADFVLETAEYSISNKKVKSVSADKITAGILAAVTKIGDNSIELNGEDKTIKIYDNSSPAKVSIYMKGGSA